MSGNHNQSLERALELVEIAAKSGADAIKLQTYTADSMTLDIHDREFIVDNPKSPWFGQSLYSLYQQAYTPWEWHQDIFDHAKKHDLIPLSAAFDHNAVDFLLELDVPCLKIASFECIDIPLIAKAAQSGVPIIISTGMASLTEISEAVTAARDYGCKDLALLKCTTTYPASPLDSNISTIPHMRNLFNCEVGISDHTLGIGVAVASVSLGASIIEKHFTTARADGGVDSMFSLEPHEFSALTEESERAWQSIGKITYGPSENEKPSLKRRRSLYITRDVQEGEIISDENIRSIRPGLGLAPKYLELVMGKTIKKSAKAGTPLSWELLI